MQRFVRTKTLAFGLVKCSEAAHKRQLCDVASEANGRANQRVTLGMY